MTREEFDARIDILAIIVGELKQKLGESDHRRLAMAVFEIAQARKSLPTLPPERGGIAAIERIMNDSINP